MKHRLALVLPVVLAHCADATISPSIEEAPVATMTFGIFGNSGFEGNESSGPPVWLTPTAPANAGPEFPPKSPWTVTTFLNNYDGAGSDDGLAVVPPTSIADLRLSTGGWPVTHDVNNAQCTRSGGTASISSANGTEVTLTNVAGFTARHVGLYLTISGAANAGYNGVFAISTYTSATQIRVANTASAGADANNGAISWSLSGCLDRDVPILFPIFGDHSLVINDGDYPGATGSPTEVLGPAGTTGSSFSYNSGTDMVTLNVAAGGVPNGTNRPLIITGSSSPSNDGYFFITARTANTITYYNPNGVSEPFSGSFWINAGGKNQNVNRLAQTMTLTAEDIDPADGQIHIRWVMAPILENPNHADNLQPYFFYLVTNKGPGGAGPDVVLGSDFNFAAQTGIPWQTLTDLNNTEATYTDWQLVDVAPNGLAQIGDQVEVEIYVAGCQPGGHWARVYVDSFGAVIPGYVANGSAPTYYWLDLQNAANNHMDYTLRYANNSGASIINPEVDFSVPAGATFVSASDPGSLSECTGITGRAGTGVSVTGVASGVATLSGLSGLTQAYVGTYVTLSGGSASNGANNGFFKVKSVIDATHATVLNGSAVTENTGALGWSVSHVRCTRPGGTGTLAAGVSGTVTITVNLDNTFAGNLFAGTYWAQGKGVSPLFGAPVKTWVSGPPDHILVTSGQPQSATVNTAFSLPLVADVRDTNGNAVMHADVTFAAPAAGASALLTSPTGFTSSNGQWRTSAVANTVAGTYNVNASAVLVAAPAVFALTNNPGSPAAVTVSGGGQVAQASTQFANPIVITVRDAYGNAVGAGVPVALTPPASGPSASFVGTLTTSASGQVSVTATANALTGAAYIVNVAATGGTSPSTTFQLQNASTAPPVAITSPADASAVSPSFTITGTTAPGATVTLTVDGTPFSPAVQPDGSWSQNVGPVVDGSHTIIASATTPGSATGTDTITVTTDSTPPSPPTIGSPSNGSNVPQFFDVSGTGEPGATVTVTVDGDMYTTTVEPDGSWTVTVGPVSGGPQTVSVTQTDPAGNTSGPATVNVTVVLPPDTTPPAAPIVTSPTPGSSVDPTGGGITVTGTAEPGSTVSVAIGNSIVTTTAGSDGSFSVVVPGTFNDGQTTVTVLATDAAGNTSAPTQVTFTVANDPANDGNTGSTGNGSDGDGGTIGGGNGSSDGDGNGSVENNGDDPGGSTIVRGGVAGCRCNSSAPPDASFLLLAFAFLMRRRRAS